MDLEESNKSFIGKSSVALLIQSTSPKSLHSCIPKCV